MSKIFPLGVVVYAYNLRQFKDILGLHWETMSQKQKLQTKRNTSYLYVVK
jgi:hypothetical protein